MVPPFDWQLTTYKQAITTRTVIFRTLSSGCPAAFIPNLADNFVNLELLSGLSCLRIADRGVSENLLEILYI